MKPIPAPEKNDFVVENSPDDAYVRINGTISSRFF